MLQLDTMRNLECHICTTQAQWVQMKEDWKPGDEIPPQSSIDVRNSMLLAGILTYYFVRNKES